MQSVELHPILADAVQAKIEDDLGKYKMTAVKYKEFIEIIKWAHSSSLFYHVTFCWKIRFLADILETLK